MGNIHNLELKGNIESCIVCGGEADVVSGVFDVLDGTLQAIRKAAVDPTAREVMKSAAEELRDGKITPETFLQRMEKINPELAGFLRMLKSNFLTAVIYFMLTVLYEEAKGAVPSILKTTAQYIEQVFDSPKKLMPNSGVANDGSDPSASINED